MADIDMRSGREGPGTKAVFLRPLTPLQIMQSVPRRSSQAARVQAFRKGRTSEAGERQAGRLEGPAGRDSDTWSQHASCAAAAPPLSQTRSRQRSCGARTAGQHPSRRQPCVPAQKPILPDSGALGFDSSPSSVLKPRKNCLPAHEGTRQQEQTQSAGRGS